jgi:NADH-quinone oxidoreductase subunit C
MLRSSCPDSVIAALQREFGSAVGEIDEINGQQRVTLDRSVIRRALELLKTLPDAPFEMLSDVTAADLSDLPGRDEEAPRFVVMYVLQSMSGGRRVVLRCEVPESDPVVDSAYPVYKSAIWMEREVYEMFGIRFADHPDLRRLLTPDYFDDENQHPLRRDYPLRGTGDRYNFPVWDPDAELDLSRFGYTPPAGTDDISDRPDAKG